MFYVPISKIDPIYDNILSQNVVIRDVPVLASAALA